MGAPVIDAHENIFSVVQIDNFDIGTEGKGSVSCREVVEVEDFPARSFFAVKMTGII